jgi:putative transcriptional regulator
MLKTKKSRRAVEDVLHGLRELASMVEQGIRPEERFTVHTVEIPEPAKYNAKAVQSLRQKLGVSQAIFAKMLGVSTILVQSWERGVREPSPLARRLLDTIRDDPGRWLGRVWESRPGAARRTG